MKLGAPAGASDGLRIADPLTTEEVVNLGSAGRDQAAAESFAASFALLSNDGTSDWDAREDLRLVASSSMSQEMSISLQEDSLLLQTVGRKNLLPDQALILRSQLNGPRQAPAEALVEVAGVSPPLFEGQGYGTFGIQVLVKWDHDSWRVEHVAGVDDPGIQAALSESKVMPTEDQLLKQTKGNGWHTLRS